MPPVLKGSQRARTQGPGNLTGSSLPSACSLGCWFAPPTQQVHASPGVSLPQTASRQRGILRFLLSILSHVTPSFLLPVGLKRPLLRSPGTPRRRGPIHDGLKAAVATLLVLAFPTCFPPAPACTRSSSSAFLGQYLPSVPQAAQGFLFFFFFFCLFRATPVAYGGSQARGQIGATAASPHHSHSKGQIQATSSNYTTTHGNAGSLTH